MRTKVLSTECSCELYQRRAIILSYAHKEQLAGKEHDKTLESVSKENNNRLG